MRVRNDDVVDDESLLVRLRAGEREAFDLLVRRYHAPMRRVAASIVGDAQAEEAVQDAWLSAIGHIADFQGRSSLKTWLYAIVANEARGRLRKSRREVSLDAPTDEGPAFGGERFLADGHWAQPPLLWDHDSPEALLGEEAFRRCLEKTLQALPEAQRTVLLLRDQDEMPLEQICNILGLSASNVRVLVHRARARVYRMAEHFEETGTC